MSVDSQQYGHLTEAALMGTARGCTLVDSLTPPRASAARSRSRCCGTRTQCTSRPLARHPCFRCFFQPAELGGVPRSCECVCCESATKQWSHLEMVGNSNRDSEFPARKSPIHCKRRVRYYRYRRRTGIPYSPCSDCECDRVEVLRGLDKPRLSSATSSTNIWWPEHSSRAARRRSCSSVGCLRRSSAWTLLEGR